jgi:hypothetical protein
MVDHGGYLARPMPSGLADVIETVLAKGIVIDAYARVSLVGIELLTIDARIVIASVDTYLRFAEATNRLDLEEQGVTLPDILERGVHDVVAKVASNVVEHKIDDAKEAVSDSVAKVTGTARRAAEKAVDLVTPDGDDDDEPDDDSGS